MNPQKGKRANPPLFPCEFITRKEGSENLMQQRFISIPSEILEVIYLDNWVAWRYEKNPSKPKPYKMPYDPRTGERAKVNDASTWANYNLVRESVESGKYEGLGFMFGTKESPSGYAGIDLDNAINDDGTLKPFARDIVQIMNTYTEYSPSKKGLHLIFKVKNRLSEEGYYKKHNDIECYDFGRYYTFTFDVFGDNAKPIEYRDSECQQVREKYLKLSASKAESKAQQFIQPINEDSDADILRKMFNSKHGARIQALYNGDISGYESQSNADLVLCNHLAYWTKKDANQMDSLFRQSKLYRDKWDKVHDGSRTYGEMTIQKAIDRTPDYVPTVYEKSQGVTEQQEQPKKEIISDTQYLDSIFESEMKNFQHYSKRKTGFSNLDNKIVLYPALYFIGAISSLGKTTFNLQLADNFAAMGEHVLYFAFEQTRFELVSKSLARLAQPEGEFYDSIPTALEIRNGRICPEIREAMQKFKEISEHKYIIECDFITDISVIKNIVEAHIKKFGVKPIVFIDYLQLIKSDNPKLTNTKDIVDSNVRALKLLQMRNELVMFVISSLNRQNYMTVIDFEAFKETGGIEYTADCVIGLQLAIMNTKLFEADSKTTKKRKVVKAAKTQTPRYIELCILKNRYGVSNESFYFQYYSKWDKFIPTTREVIEQACLNLVNSVPDDDEKKKPR